MAEQRGGVGNIGAPHVPPATHPHDTDAIPPAAIRQIHDDDRDHHVGVSKQASMKTSPPLNPSHNLAASQS